MKHTRTTPKELMARSQRALSIPAQHKTKQANNNLNTLTQDRQQREMTTGRFGKWRRFLLQDSQLLQQMDCEAIILMI